MDHSELDLNHITIPVNITLILEMYNYNKKGKFINYNTSFFGYCSLLKIYDKKIYKMKPTKLKFRLLLTFLCILNITATFAEENNDAPYLPQDKASIVWENIEFDKYGQITGSGHIKCYYVGKDGNQYVANFFQYDSLKTRNEFLATQLYKLFGFPSSPQYLVDIVKITDVDLYGSTIAIVTKNNPNLRPLSDYSPKELSKMDEQLAKLHIISALIGNSSLFPDEHTDEGIFVDQQQIWVTHPVDNFFTYVALGYNNKYGPKAIEFKKNLELQSSWHTALIYQKPFQNYTLNHIPELIAWLDSVWDEKKVDALFKDAGLTDAEVLINLKLRFQDIKNQLEKIQHDGYQLYTIENFSKLINEKTPPALNNKYVAKNIHYEFINTLPKIEEQIFICTDGAKVWLELTNFEFLVNSKESNNIVKVYVGDVSSNDKLNATEKYALEIFDPEAAFVFSDAIVRHWDSLSPNTAAKNPFLELAKAIQVGYLAMSYHFGFANSLENKDILRPISSLKDFLEFNQTLFQKYSDEAKSISRSVTKEEIEKRKSQDLIAFYPNPAYLDDIVWYIRPQDMNYEEYIKLGKEDLRGKDGRTNCRKDYLAKSSEIDFDHCDEYSWVIEKIYPDDVVYQNATHKYRSSDFRRISAYSFRGDSRPIDEIYNEGGFWSKINKNGHIFSFQENKKEILDDQSLWEIPMCYNRPCPGNKAYVSTSSILDVTKAYGDNVYAIFADGGLSLPSDFSGRKIHGADLYEIAIPGGAEWENVVGVRARKMLADQKNKKHLIGPVFLKASLAENDPKNFWEILQIMGGKQQCANINYLYNVSKLCLGLLDGSDEKKLHKFFRSIFIEYYYNDLGLNNQEMEAASASAAISTRLSFADLKKYSSETCKKSLEGALGLKTYIRRR